MFLVLNDSSFFVNDDFRGGILVQKCIQCISLQEWNDLSLPKDKIITI